MSFTEVQALERLRALGKQRTEVVLEEASEGAPDLIHGTLVLAIGLRETSIRNITGDGGHGRGWLQIDDRFHQAFLSAHPGCKNGTWGPFVYSKSEDGAFPKGRVPGMLAAERYAITLLRANEEFGKVHGVPAAHRKRFMLAAYNCGAGNALRAFRNFGSHGIDRYTAGGDYGWDVLENQEAVRGALRRLAW